VNLRDENGIKYGVKHINNKLHVSSMPYTFDIAKGNVPKHTAIRKFGHSSSVGATVEEVWDGSTAYVYLSNAATVYITSDDDSDDQIYEVQGLDADWNYQILNVTCAGFTPVALNGTWMRIFRVKNIGVTDNAGTIYFSTDPEPSGSDGVPDTGILAQITVGFNQTLMALWTVPADYTAYMISFYAATSSSKATEVHLYVRSYGGVFQIKKLLTIYEGYSFIPYSLPLVIAAKSDIVIKAKAALGGGEVSAGFDLWFEG